MPRGFTMRLGHSVGFGSAWALWAFLIVWLAAALTNGIIGVRVGGQTVMAEALVLEVVFGAPVVFAVLLARRGRA